MIPGSADLVIVSEARPLGRAGWREARLAMRSVPPAVAGGFLEHRLGGGLDILVAPPQHIAESLRLSASSFSRQTLGLCGEALPRL
jgi:hypothetical protein